MKTLTKIALVLIPTITLSLSATAHGPKMHEKKAEQADCSRIDSSKMDMKDPVVIAMMKKCMKQDSKSKGDLNNNKITQKSLRKEDQKVKNKGGHGHNH
jgi:hypothetical protein